MNQELVDRIEEYKKLRDKNLGVDDLQFQYYKGVIQGMEEVIDLAGGTKTVAPFKDWCNNLYTNIQNLLVELTGKKQKTDKIKGKSYSFLCNKVDLYSKLNNICKVHNITDLVKAEKVILGYIRNCNKEGSWFPILEYYISKDGKSKFATDYDNFDESLEVKKEVNNIVYTKDLF